MLQRARHVFIGISLVILLSVQVSSAASFGRIDVASHLGEPFFAEVPLRLNKEEDLSKVSVDLGASSDYRILEVYRDQVVDSIHVEVIDDERGARVVLSSDVSVNKAFFHMVLKVRYGRSTHYKKVPVFLETASISVSTQAVQPEAKAAPAVNASSFGEETSKAFISKDSETKDAEEIKTDFAEPGQEAAIEIVEADSGDAAAVASAASLESDEDWARISRYGPMVFGDTITTVAKRLRTDDRFTNEQVMVALFERNKKQFSDNNINIIKTGVFLDVPTADEVKKISVKEAKRVLTDHDKSWKKLVKQPKYAAVADAQKTRYTRRVRIGEKASGVSSRSILTPETTDATRKAEAVEKSADSLSSIEAASVKAKLEAAEETLAKRDNELSMLKNKVADMESRLAESGKAALVATSVKDSGYTSVSPDSAALIAQSKRLEIVISRLKGQLEQARAEASQGQGAVDWMVYALGGLALLVIALLAALVVLLRRKPKHPAQSDNLGFEDTGKQFVENVDAATYDSDAESTKIMDAGEFEQTAAAVGDMFEDSELEEIPDLTDDETGEIEPFDSEEEAPDPNVNYIEEAEVYIRYGMEDEAKKQLLMALKLKKDDVQAHAKLVQLERSRGDSAAADQALTAAKSVLVGAALSSFEQLLAGAGEVVGENPDMSLSDLDSEPSTEDTGIVDFGDIDFNSVGDSSEAVMGDGNQDTGELDFGDLDIALPEIPSEAEEEQEDESVEGMDLGGMDFDFSSMSDDEGAEDVSSESEEADALDFNFSDIEEPLVESEDESPVAEESALEEIDFDFSSMADFEEAAAEPEALGSVEADLEETTGIEDLNLDSTAEISFDDETVAMNIGFESADEEVEAINDREIDKAKAAEEESINAVSVTLDTEAEDPFADATQSLNEASEDSLSFDWTGDDSEDQLMAETDNLLSLNEDTDDDSLSEPVAESDDLLSMDAGLADAFNFDDLEVSDTMVTGEIESLAAEVELTGDSGEESELSDETEGFGFGDLEADDLLTAAETDVESEPVEEADEFGFGDLDAEDLLTAADTDVESEPVEETDEFGFGDLEVDDLLMTDTEQLADATEEVSELISDEQDIDGLNFDDLEIKDLSALETPAEDLQSLNMGMAAESDDFDSTMLLNNLTDDMNDFLSAEDGDASPAAEDQSEASAEAVSSLDEDEFGLDDMGLDDFSFGDAADSGSLESPAEDLQSLSMGMAAESDDFDSTMLLNNLTDDMNDFLSAEDGDASPAAEDQSEASAEAVSSLDEDEFGLDDMGLDDFSFGDAADSGSLESPAEDLQSLSMGMAAESDDFDSTMLLNNLTDDMSGLISASDKESSSQPEAATDIDLSAKADDEFSFDDLGLDDLSFGDSDKDDLNTFETVSNDLQSLSMGMSDEEFDSTMIMNNINDDLSSVIGSGKEGSEAGSSKQNNSDPMADDYSATLEMDQINDSMGDLTGDASELDSMMSDLDGLFDEDESK